MTSRIFRSISSVAIAVFLASLALIMGVLYDYFSGTQMTRLRSETELVADAVEISGVNYLRSLDATDDDLRITWIQPDGSVTYDNKADTNGMENHLEREEIKAALESGEGESSRYSTTLTERQLYCARRLGDGSVLRLSASHLSWWVLILSMISPILTVFGIALALSLLLAYRLSRRIVRPLNELDLEHPEPGSYYEELSPLVDRIIGQKNQLRIQKAELDRKTKEFDTATRNMSEGIVLLSDSGAVLSINDSALRLLGISSYCIGKDLLLFSDSGELRELIATAQNGGHCERIIELDGGSYQLCAKPDNVGQHGLGHSAHYIRYHRKGEGGADAARVYRQCFARAENTAPEHIRLCRAALERNGEAGGRAALLRAHQFGVPADDSACRGYNQALASRRGRG